MKIKFSISTRVVLSFKTFGVALFLSLLSASYADNNMSNGFTDLEQKIAFNLSSHGYVEKSSTEKIYQILDFEYLTHVNYTKVVLPHRYLFFKGKLTSGITSEVVFIEKTFAYLEDIDNASKNITFFSSVCLKSVCIELNDSDVLTEVIKKHVHIRRIQKLDSYLPKKETSDGLPSGNRHILYTDDGKFITKKYVIGDLFVGLNERLITMKTDYFDKYGVSTNNIKVEFMFYGDSGKYDLIKID